MYYLARALAVKFPGGVRKRRPKIALFKPFQGENKKMKNIKERPKNTMYENPGGATSSPLAHAY